MKQYMAQEKGSPMPIRACIFDFDGTLADSMWVWEEIGQRFLSDRGLPPDDGITEYLAINGLGAGAKGLVERYQLAEDPEEILADWLDFASGRYESQVMLKPGAKEFLNSLHAAGIRITTATAQELGPLVAALRLNEVLELFDAVVVCSDVTSTGKATPAVYHYAADRLGVCPSECVVFEDVAAAAAVASSAGFFTAGVADSGPQQDRDRLVAVCDEFIEGFEGIDAGFLAAFDGDALTGVEIRGDA